MIVAIAAPKLYRIARARVGRRRSPRTRHRTATSPTWAGWRPPRRSTSGAWSRRLDSDTLALGVHVDFDHLERRPDVRPGPRHPARRNAPRARRTTGRPGRRTGRPAAGRALLGLPVEAREPGSESSLGPAEVPEVDAPFEEAVPEPAVRERASREGRQERGTGDPRSPGPGAAAEEAHGAPARSALLPTRLGVVLGCPADSPRSCLYWVPALRLGEADLDRMGGLGLISVLPTATLVGAGLLVVVFASLLWLGREHRTLLLVTLLATLVSLHALPAVIETEPRFATAWQHLGFLDYIDRTGTAVPDLDARWSWPGFFAAAAFVLKACGVSDFTEVIRWWPLAIQLLYLAPMFLLTRRGFLGPVGDVLRGRLLARGHLAHDLGLDLVGLAGGRELVGVVEVLWCLLGDRGVHRGDEGRLVETTGFRGGRLACLVGLGLRVLVVGGSDRGVLCLLDLGVRGWVGLGGPGFGRDVLLHGLEARIGRRGDARGAGRRCGTGALQQEISDGSVARQHLQTQHRRDRLAGTGNRPRASRHSRRGRAAGQVGMRPLSARPVPATMSRKGRPRFSGECGRCRGPALLGSASRPHSRGYRSLLGSRWTA